MPRMVIERTINAPIDKVFATISDISEFSKAIPHIVSVEILSENRIGKGTRFRETRVINKREASTELTVSEFVENERIRMISESHGTLWDSIFTVKPAANGAILTLTMDSRTNKLFNKILNSLIHGVIKKAVANDMDAVKDYCEKR